MNQYFTEVEIEDVGWRIGYDDKVMLMGSCFAENIGERLQRLKFQADVNPFGIIYNPVSVAKSIRILLSDKIYNEKDLFEHDGIWGSFDHHSRFSSTAAEQTLQNINSRLERSRTFLKEANYLIITLGTSCAYELKQSGEVVSNCHKFTSGTFKRFRLDLSEIVTKFKDLLTDVWRFNSDLRILFTVSPIRHWKDGAVGNQLSKSTLLLAVDRLVSGFGNERCAYFPSYEIVMDELRDYRFYAPDLLHLSSVAVDHIWEKFSKVMISEESLKLSKDVVKIIKASEHRPFNSGSESYEKFLLYNLRKIEELTINFPYLNLTVEKTHFECELRGSQEKRRH